ncbi:MAG: hypothetical protein ACREU5_06960 [Burkholderiales bacterium]
MLELVEAGRPPSVAPLYRVRCPDCQRAYETRSWLRDLVQRERCRPCSDERRSRKAKRNATNRPSDLPTPEAFATRPHGLRVRYMAGCRCDECREANNSYERMRGKLRRNGEANGLVDAARVRRHLLRLSRAGIGRRTVADVAGVSASIVGAVRSGRKARLRAQTAKRILAVGPDVLTDAKLVDARSTWRKIERLLAEGFTRGAIAVRLGMQSPALQLRKDRVTARNRARVDRLYREIMGAETRERARALRGF